MLISYILCTISQYSMWITFFSSVDNVDNPVDSWYKWFRDVHNFVEINILQKGIDQDVEKKSDGTR